MASCHSKFAVYEVINCRTIVSSFRDVHRKCKYSEINIIGHSRCIEKIAKRDPISNSLREEAVPTIIYMITA